MGILSPLYIILAILIKINSSGPSIFKQERIGKDGKLFTIYKFRTMHNNAENMKLYLKDKNETNRVLFKMKNDPRVTSIGKYLRKSSLDELPQLWNVLKGNMSLIGPRPALPEEVSQYSENEYKRLEVKPGCSGLWQVSGRSDLSFDSMIKLDLEYIEKVNLKHDLIIIFKTIVIMVTGKGAY